MEWNAWASSRTWFYALRLRCLSHDDTVQQIALDRNAIKPHPPAFLRKNTIAQGSTTFVRHEENVKNEDAEEVQPNCSLVAR